MCPRTPRISVVTGDSEEVVREHGQRSETVHSLCVLIAPLVQLVYQQTFQYQKEKTKEVLVENPLNLDLIKSCRQFGVRCYAEADLDKCLYKGKN